MILLTLLLKRLSAVYDVQNFSAAAINRNLRGLGHTGWGVGGNPIHCMRFRRNDQESVSLTYKLNESDKDWLPKNVYDETTANWTPAPEGYAYELITKEDTVRLLQGPVVPSIIRESAVKDLLQESILSTKLPGTKVYCIYSIYPNRRN